MKKYVMGVRENEKQNGTLHRMLQLVEEQVLVWSDWQISFFLFVHLFILLLFIFL